jgi:hypothetical protein
VMGEVTGGVEAWHVRLKELQMKPLKEQVVAKRVLRNNTHESNRDCFEHRCRSEAPVTMTLPGSCAVSRWCLEAANSHKSSHLFHLERCCGALHCKSMIN